MNNGSWTSPTIVHLIHLHCLSEHEPIIVLENQPDPVQLPLPVHKFWTVKLNEKYFQISEDDVTQISDIRISGYKPKLYIIIGQQLESISFNLGMV